MSKHAALAAIVPLAALALSASAADEAVPRWQPHDFTFTSKAPADNPFQTPFSAEIKSPDGKTFTLPGFYDGDNTWKIRISPTSPGQWSFTTRSTNPGLNNKQASFACIPNPAPAIHGPLRIDPDHPNQFIFEDGTRVFPMGYECDWLWALDSGDPTLKTLNPFLDKIQSSGFNFIILNAFAYDTSWRKGHTADDDFGPPPLFAWAGTNDKPDHARFNLAYWQHYDLMIDALCRRGITAHILMKVYNKQVSWPANGTPDDDQYYRWLIARYAAYPNITWDLAKEAQYEKDATVKTDRLRFIRAIDPYHRLLTVHDDKAVYDKGTYNDLVDYRSDQQHTQWQATMLSHLQHPWPVINTEFGYEQGPKGSTDKTYSVAQSPEEVCRRAWEVCTSGGFPAYYYTYTAWDVLRPQDTPPGYAYFKNLAEFFNRTNYWRMTPAEGLASDGYCLAELGSEYIVFLNVAATFTLKVEGATAPLPAQWYQPYTGAAMDAGNINNGTTSLTPPVIWGKGPVALHVGIAR